MILATAGGSRPVQCVYQPINAQGGGTVVVIRDLTETLRAEANRTRLAAIVANSADAIYSVDAALRVRSWNRGAELLYGYPAAEMIGRDLSLLYEDPADYREFQESTAKIGLSGDYGRFESNRRCRSGKLLTVSVSLAPICSVLEGETEFACIERDVSAEKEREAALRAAKVLAEEANRAKDDFLANVSHELRTPLNGILGMVEISRGVADAAEREEYLEIAHRQADDLLFLINSLLDYSQLEVGKMRLEAQAFSPAACAQACVEHLAPEFRAKGLAFEFYPDASLPELLLGDEHRIAQIIHHLLSNAVKFTSRGSVRLELDALGTDQPGTVGLRIRVTDTGIGIPQDRLGLIWDKFIQLDASRTRSYGGTGMGLALVKSLTELLGGTVGVTSIPDAGSEFMVVIPLASPGGSATPKT
jgi:PAS domain S-box-containing protein